MSASPVNMPVRPSQLHAVIALLDRLRLLLRNLNAQNVPWEKHKANQVETVASIAIPGITVAKRA